RGRVRQPRPLGDAQGVRRPPGEERMTETVQPELQHKNPLMEGLKLRRAPDPCALVIFGASGDLTKRKLFPALYSLALRKLLPSRFGVVGAARTEETDDEFRERMKAGVQEFGRDLESAKALTAELMENFTESEIFRIDHYLGKETVQNLLALRFANGIFEPIWNRQFVDHVQITVAESIGIEGRAAFYEQAGAIRDIFQNHLLQLLALTAMEPPIDFTADSVRNEKVKVLKSMHTPGPKSVVRGQYGAGFVEGIEVPGYREEDGVAPGSLTETYIAAKLYVDNWRWADTPFYVRMGKRLARHETTIAIQFKQAPHPPFEESAA